MLALSCHILQRRWWNCFKKQRLWRSNTCIILWQRRDGLPEHNLSSPIKTKWFSNVSDIWNVSILFPKLYRHTLWMVLAAFSEIFSTTEFILPFSLWHWSLVPDAVFAPNWRRSKGAENVTWTGFHANNWTGNNDAGWFKRATPAQ